jgi:methyl-accepting chemotaxis protein
MASEKTQPRTTSLKRRNFYIDKDFQTIFIIKFCALVAGGALLTIAFLYLMSRYSTTVSIVKARVMVMTTGDFLLPLLVQTVLVVTLVVSLAAAVVTLFVSHKIAGPLYRFKQTFKDLSMGNFSNQVRLRKEDQLQEVATEFNQMITAVRGQIHAANASLDAVKTHLDTIGEFNVEEHKRKQFTDLKQKVHDLEKALHFFRT